MPSSNVRSPEYLATRWVPLCAYIILLLLHTQLLEEVDIILLRVKIQQLEEVVEIPLLVIAQQVQEVVKIPLRVVILLF